MVDVIIVDVIIVKDLECNIDCVINLKCFEDL